MILNIILSAVLAACMFINYTGAGIADVSVNAASVTAQKCEAADYDKIELTTVKGNKLEVKVDGSNLIFVSSGAKSISIEVASFESGKRVAYEHKPSGDVKMNVASKMNTKEIYQVTIQYSIDGINYTQEEIMLMKNGKNVAFVKSPVYDFSKKRCSEMWTDKQSLEECLKPQNDIECNDPFIINLSNEICEGLTSDWDKSYAIYTYIVSELYYDDIQLEDEKYNYQDDAASVLRRKIAICEGFSNAYVALCRAQGIPAVVEFGTTELFSDYVLKKDVRNDEWPNHAWAAVYLGDEWLFVDPTFDNNNKYTGNDRQSGKMRKARHTYNYYLIPLEVLCVEHKMLDADTVHGIESNGSCGDNATYTITRDGVLTIYGSGEIVLPDGVNGFSKVVFDPSSNITAIGENCFVDCDLITEVILPDTVTKIARCGFSTCEDLEYIYLPEGLKTIGREAFDICDELAYVYVPDSVTSISMYAFDDCPRLIISVPKALEGFDKDNYIPCYRVIVRN